MCRGELREGDLEQVLYFVIKEWLDNCKLGIQEEKIVRSEDGNFDVRIKAINEHECYMQIRLFDGPDFVCQHGLTMYDGTFEKYTETKEKLIAAVALDISKTTYELERKVRK